MRYDYGCTNEKCEFQFLVEHGMTETPEIKCPKCSSNAQRIFIVAPEFYTRGYGYCDKTGARRDMNLYKLVNDDPYGHMRQPGEKDDMANKLRKGGKFNPNRQYIAPKGRVKNRKK